MACKKVILGGKRPTHAIMCNGCQEPGADGECWEAIWSLGKACKKCDHECYRAGWDKKRVDEDNQRLVERCDEGRWQGAGKGRLLGEHP